MATYSNGGVPVNGRQQLNKIWGGQRGIGVPEYGSGKRPAPFILDRFKPLPRIGVCPPKPGLRTSTPCSSLNG
jgi:hypothetical protein